VDDAKLLALVLGVSSVHACIERHEPPIIASQDLRLVVLHTTDIHSRLLPYDMTVLAGDQNLGLLQENRPFGGIARLAHVVKRERARGARTIYVDSGDCFQGAPIFNAFVGEVEQRALSLMRPDAVVIGNHEFDEGLSNYTTQLDAWATYPLVAANYLFEPGEPLGEIAKPFEVIEAQGMKIGVIGVGNFSSLSSVTDVGNSLKMVPLQIHEVVQDWIDFLDPHVDLIVALSHGGLSEDEDMIKNTRGLDLVMGGHLHIVLSPPKVIQDKAGREVILAHSGAFAKFVGRLDVVVRDGEVTAHDYQVFPIDSRLPEDPEMLDLIEPYRLLLHQTIDLESVYGYATKLIRRFGFDGGDSPLGNLVSEAIRQYARADFGMTNSLGIRTDLNPGPVHLDQLFNIFPFNNYVTTMYVSGTDVLELFDYVTRRSASRGCATQVQVAGIEFVMDCTEDPDCGEPRCPPMARDVVITECGNTAQLDTSGCTRFPVEPEGVYEMATNDYIAQGGSGFTTLKVNNTQVVTDVALRDAVLEVILKSPLCVEECRRPDGGLWLEGCVGYEQCVADLAEFYARPCLGAAEINPGAAGAVEHCAFDVGGLCKKTEDCYADDGCAAAGCQVCQASGVCPEGLDCIGGYCRPPTLVCDTGRCQRACADDADCPGAALAAAAGQAVCVGSICEPREGSPCETDAGCVVPDDVCPAGGCPACVTAAQCDADQLCVEGQCVRPLAVCVDRVCRARCTSDTACVPGEVCSALLGHCRPRRCEGGQNVETACVENARYRAAERCLVVPCAAAESDGRIGRILPANLAGLPNDENPDDEALE
jgi:5'-nucleotidase